VAAVGVVAVAPSEGSESEMSTGCSREPVAVAPAPVVRRVLRGGGEEPVAVLPVAPVDGRYEEPEEGPLPRDENGLVREPRGGVGVAGDAAVAVEDAKADSMRVAVAGMVKTSASPTLSIG
jgi:hypothetical protein